MKLPRIIIAGTNSGCGKTTACAGLMAALAKRGVRVQPFKAGPDYIDPMFHTFVTARHSRNLDSWMLDEKTLLRLFAKNSTGCDVSVIEGVMGFYDGFGENSIEGSTAHISKLLKCPVILVVNAGGMSLSAAAMIKGFMDFRGGADVKGVILNKISGEALFQHLKDIIEENAGVSVLGYIPLSEGYSLPERHLGLVPGGEVPELKDRLDRLAETIGRTVNLELVMKIAENSPELEEEETPFRKTAAKTRIAVAMDKSFNFYYRDNLELLEDLGAELAFFSPLEDEKMPDDVGGAYFGGGYPEIFAEKLSMNYQMRLDVKSRLSAGLPAYAECGGMMYLCRTLKDGRGSEFEMAGVLPARCEMTGKLQRFGYVNIILKEECVLGEPGCGIRAHEFHYSSANLDEGAEDNKVRCCYDVLKHKKTGEASRWNDGWKIKNTLAGYPHLHFWSNPGFAESFVEKCSAWRKLSKGK